MHIGLGLRTPKANIWYWYQCKKLCCYIALMHSEHVHYMYMSVPLIKWCVTLIVQLVNTTVTELQIRDLGLLVTNFVRNSYDVSQFECPSKVQRSPPPHLITQNLTNFSQCLDTSGAYVSRQRNYQRIALNSNHALHLGIVGVICNNTVTPGWCCISMLHF